MAIGPVGRTAGSPYTGRRLRLGSRRHRSHPLEAAVRIAKAKPVLVPVVAVPGAVSCGQEGSKEATAGRGRTAVALARWTVIVTASRQGARAIDPQTVLSAHVVLASPVSRVQAVLQGLVRRVDVDPPAAVLRGGTWHPF